MNKDFTQKKFLRLDNCQQHRHCSSLLKLIYTSILKKEEIGSYFEKYQTFLSWLKLSDFSFTSDLKKISQQYHWHLHQAQILLKEHNLLPSIRQGDHTPKKSFGNIAVFLDNIRSAYNVGSILRTTEALRIGSLYFGGKTPFLDNTKVEKTSMGTSCIVPCRKEFSLQELPRPWIALETSNEATAVADFIFPSSFTLILGNEEFGVSDFMLKEADLFLEIPLYGKKNSINVACAYAIAASEICTQTVRLEHV